MKTRGRRHNSGSKRHTRKHYMRGGKTQQSENAVNGVIKVYDDTTPDTDGNWLVVPYLMNPTDGVKFADKTQQVWTAFRQYFIGQTGTDYLNKIIPTICNPNLPSASSASATSTPTESSLIDLSESPETSSTSASSESEIQVNPDLQGLSFGGKRKIRRY